jgi:RNA polymerase-binding transcription factor DksA
MGSPTPKSQAKPRAYTDKELAVFRIQLVQQLELVHGNLRALSADNLKRSPVDANGDISTHSTHMADHGTDNFDRELALNLASGRQENLYDIEDAIRRIDEGTYGVCESCGGPIEHPRLKALPFAKKCVACQSASEKGRTRYRPFGGTLAMQQYNTPDESAHDEPQE